MIAEHRHAHKAARTERSLIPCNAPVHRLPPSMRVHEIHAEIGKDHGFGWAVEQRDLREPAVRTDDKLVDLTAPLLLGCLRECDPRWEVLGFAAPAPAPRRPALWEK